MTFQDDVAFTEKHLPVIKRVVKALAVGVLVLTVWKGVHGFGPTAGIVGAAVLYLIAEIL